MSETVPPPDVRRSQRDEAPVLALEKVALCLHFVEQGLIQTSVAEYPDCPTLRSIELDLLAYSFQESPPLGSQCETYRKTPVEIHFPESLEYTSEGETVTLGCKRTLVSAAVVVTSTGFLHSGTRVWHLVLAPAEGNHFNEFDLIKLIHLYDGRTEGTSLRSQVRFRRPDGPELDAAGLLRALCPDAGKGATLRSGTLEVLTGGASAATVRHEVLLADVRTALGPEDTASDDRIREWLAGESLEGRIIKAYCGIVSGIFDHEFLDAAEVLDTLTPTLDDIGSFTRSHRGTLVYLAETDRLMERCWDSIGISPYLLIPHALVLYNEALVAEADAAVQAVLANPKSGRAALEAAQALAERNLNNLFLPNLFNYATEQELYERMWRARGSGVRREAAMTRLQELSGTLNTAWEARREHGQMGIAVLLALLSVIQIKDIVLSLAGDGKPMLGWSLFGVLAAAICVLIVAFWRMGIRR